MKSLSLSRILLSTVVAALCGCSAGDNEETVVSDEYDVTGMASKMGGSLETIDLNASTNYWDTRSIFFGGSNGSKFFQVWDDLDKPQMYLGSLFLAKFTPKEKGVTTTTLSGTVKNATLKVGDKLTLYSPSPDCNFLNQTGTIADMSAEHSFMTAEATVASVSKTKITTSSMTFSSFATYWLCSFLDENNRLLHVKRLTITTENSTLAATMNLLSGAVETTNEYVIDVAQEKGADDYPTSVYVVIHDTGTVNNTFTFTVLASDGKTYQKKNDISALFNVGGKAYSLRRQLTCIDVEAGVSTGITPPTDEDVQIDDVVKE